MATRYRDDMTLAEEAALLAECAELEAAYARAAGDFAQRGPTRTVFRINWDNGAEACGTFPDDYPTYDAAQAAGDTWANECNARDGIDPGSEQAYTAEAVPVEIPDPDAEAFAVEIEELQKAALSNGQP